MKSILNLFCVSIFALLSCKKIDSIPLADYKPEISVTVSNATDFRPGPAVRTSKAAGGAISITLEIPASSGRKIKQITKVSASTSYAALQNASVAYNVAPILPAASGLSVTFNTTLSEYYLKTAATPNPATSNLNLGRAFYFLITLDNDKQLISYAVNVLVID